MRTFLTLIALTLGLNLAPTTADAFYRETGEDLRFVAQTTMPGSSENTVMSLCHLVEYANVVFIPAYTIIQGYALSDDGCSGTAYRSLNAEQVGALQGLGLLPAELPLEPRASYLDLLKGHLLMVLVGVGLLGKGLHSVMTRGKPRSVRKPDHLAIHSLVAMSQVALADGRIDDAEVLQISKILTRLTGNGYAPGQVADMLNKLNPSHNDLAEVGQNLSENDRVIILEAAINIAAADGEIHQSEYAVISDLAQRMRIGAEQFRATLTRISAHLQPVGAT